MHNINWHQKISPSPIPPKRSKSSYPTPYILFNLLHTDKAKRDTLYKTPHPTLPSCWCEIDSNLIPSLKFMTPTSAACFSNQHSQTQPVTEINLFFHFFLKKRVIHSPYHNNPPFQFNIVQAIDIPTSTKTPQKT